jgi:hypothetical protein
VAVESQEGHQSVPQRSEVLRRMTFVDLAGILAQSHIPDVVRAVFNVPMAPPPLQQFDGPGQRARHARDGILDLDLVTSITPRGPGQAANLLEPGPIDVVCQSCGDFQLSLDEATVFLPDRFRAIKVRHTLPFVRRGKKPPENRRPRLPSALAGSL